MHALPSGRICKIAYTKILYHLLNENARTKTTNKIANITKKYLLFIAQGVFLLAFRNGMGYILTMISFNVKNLVFSHVRTQKNERYFCATHCHNAYEIYLILQGDVDYIVADHLYSLHPYDLLVIPPSVYHCAHSVKGEYERVVINFKKKDINANVQRLLGELDIRYYLKNNVFIRSLVFDFLPLVETAAPELKIQMVKDLLELIVIQLSASQTVPEAELVHPTLSAIVEYIDGNLDKKLSLDHISKSFFVSKSWINYAFRKYYKIGYSQYVKTKKMNYAQTLLQSGTSPKTVAVMCGFEIYTTFLRQYKEFFNHLPSSDCFEE